MDFFNGLLGAPEGINLLGVGDCNNDGVFNNFDIDCFVNVVVCGNPCECEQACCLPTGGCIVMLPSACALDGGEPAGAGVICDDTQENPYPCLGESMMPGFGESLMGAGSESGTSEETSDFWETIAWLRSLYGM